MSILQQIERMYGPVADTDSYKLSHAAQFPKGTTNMFSYIESRGGEFNETVFFGLQYILKEYFSSVVTETQVKNMAKFAKDHGEPFNLAGWMVIIDEYNGILPVKIRAVPEGTVVPVKNVLCTIELTVDDARIFWLVNYLETRLLRVWYPITVASKSREMKKLIKVALNKTCDNPLDNIAFSLLDFGARGVASMEQSILGTGANLVNFMGSDSIVGVIGTNITYNEDMSAFSVPATEHSVMCAFGEEREQECFENLLEIYKDFPVVSVVSDAYDIFSACEKWGTLVNKVKENQQTLVIRPDSGDHVEVLSRMYPIIERGFGSVVNDKGFKVFNNVKVLWGDGIEYSTIERILKCVSDMGYSTETIILGSGGGLLQKMNRDTFKFAMKCSATKSEDGAWKDIFKQPITDPGKVSKKGRMTLVQNIESGDFSTVKLPLNELEHPYIKEVLRDVWINGELLIDDNLSDIRERATL